MINGWVKKAVQEFIAFRDDPKGDFAEIAIIMQNGKYEAVPIEYITEQNTSKESVPLTQNEEEKFEKYLM